MRIACDKSKATTVINKFWGSLGIYLLGCVSLLDGINVRPPPPFRPLSLFVAYIFVQHFSLVKERAELAGITKFWARI